MSTPKSYVDQYAHNMKIVAMEPRMWFNGAQYNVLCHCRRILPGKTIGGFCDDCQDTYRMPIPRAEVIQSDNDG